MAASRGDLQENPIYWFWEIAAKGSGPEYFASLQFDDSAVGHLEEMVRELILPGFKYIKVTPDLIPHGAQECTYDLYINQHHYDQMIDNLKKTNVKNIRIYHTISVKGNKLEIERGYGGYGGIYDKTETELLCHVTSSPQLSLFGWQIYAGGQGYDLQPIAEGQTAGELLAYISGNKAR